MAGSAGGRPRRRIVRSTRGPSERPHLLLLPPRSGKEGGAGARRAFRPACALRRDGSPPGAVRAFLVLIAMARRAGARAPARGRGGRGERGTGGRSCRRRATGGCRRILPSRRRSTHPASSRRRAHAARRSRCAVPIKPRTKNHMRIWAEIVRRQRTIRLSHDGPHERPAATQAPICGRPRPPPPGGTVVLALGRLSSPNRSATDAPFRTHAGFWMSDAAGEGRRDAD